MEADSGTFQGKEFLWKHRLWVRLRKPMVRALRGMAASPGLTLQDWKKS